MHSKITNINKQAFNKLILNIKNPSTLLGLLSAICLSLGLYLPAIDFSSFHKDINFSYSIIKICDNIGIISSVWNGVPYGIAIGIIALVILSFAALPILKIFPALLETAMIAIILFDINHIINWVYNVLDKFHATIPTQIDFFDVLKSFMPGYYFLIIGIILAYVSCFVPSVTSK